jgi:hypothetical protein
LPGFLPEFLAGSESPRDAAHSLLTFALIRRPEGWLLGDVSAYVEFMRDEVEPCVDETAGTILKSRAIVMSERHSKLARGSGRLSLTRALPSYDSWLAMEAYHQAYAREALRCCAIERFRLKHGRIPEDLNELVPEVVGKLPCDPVNGLPLRYERRGEGGYLLYSIGWNERDYGGVQRKKYREEGDWVWASDPKLIVNPDQERKDAEAKEVREWEEKRMAEAKAPGGIPPGRSETKMSAKKTKTSGDTSR